VVQGRAAGEGGGTDGAAACGYSQRIFKRVRSECADNVKRELATNVMVKSGRREAVLQRTLI
jgi:hypothetical protein